MTKFKNSRENQKTLSVSRQDPSEKSPEKVPLTGEVIASGDSAIVVDGEATQAAAQPEQPLSGRSCFSVNRVDIGVSVETVFLTEGGELIRLPGVFPNREYAHEQIRALMKLVDEKFDEMAHQDSSWYTATA
jgi:hypothetical protein